MNVLDSSSKCVIFQLTSTYYQELNVVKHNATIIRNKSHVGKARIYAAVVDGADGNAVQTCGAVLLILRSVADVYLLVGWCCHI